MDVWQCSLTYKGLGHAGDPQLLGIAQVYQLVDQPRLPLLDHHVLRLQVTVDDSSKQEYEIGTNITARLPSVSNERFDLSCF